MRELFNSDICIVNGFNNKFNQLYFEYFDKKNSCRLVKPEKTTDLDTVLVSSDVVLCCWCDNITAYLSRNKTRLDSKSKIFTYIRSYEMLTDQFIKQVDWSNISGIIFVAEHVQKYANQKFPFLNNMPQVVVHNSVNLDNVPFYDSTTNSKNIGFISYINHKKGITLLMQCLKSAVNYDNSIKLHIAGSFQEERYKYYIENFVTSNNLNNNIVFYDWVEDIYSWLKDMNFVISTSPWEGCPNNVIESMSVGVMPIVHRWPGAENLFPNSFIFDSVNDFIDILKNNIDKYTIMSRSDIRNIVNEKFNSKINLPKLDNFIAQQIKDKSIQIKDLAETKNTDKIVIRWLTNAKNEMASARLRCLKICESLNQYFGDKVDASIIQNPTELEYCNVLILQRQFGKHIDALINHYKEKFNSKIILDLTDVYPEAKETSNKCDFILTSSKYRIEQLKDVGFNVPIYYIDDPVDYDIDDKEIVDLPQSLLSEELKPVWFGTYSNIRLLDFVAKFVNNGTAITSENVKFQIPENWDFIKWDYDSFIDELQQFNVCLLYQTDSGKSVNKLITALSCGVPCIMSNIPAYREVAEIFSIEEYLCETEEQWTNCVEKLKNPINRIEYIEKVHGCTFSKDNMFYKVSESHLMKLFSKKVISQRFFELISKHI